MRLLLYVRVSPALGNPLVKQSHWLRDGEMQWIIQPEDTKNTTFPVCTQWIILSMRSLKMRGMCLDYSGRDRKSEMMRDRSGTFGIQIVHCTIDSPGWIIRVIDYPHPRATPTSDLQHLQQRQMEYSNLVLGEVQWNWWDWGAWQRLHARCNLRLECFSIPFFIICYISELDHKCWDRNITEQQAVLAWAMHCK